MKPSCKRCYDRFPNELKKRISDNLKEREIDSSLRKRSASPAAGVGGRKSVSRD